MKIQPVFTKMINFGNRIANLGYLFAYPSYSKVRGGQGNADLYQLLNKKWFYKTDIKLVIDIGANEGQSIITSLALMPHTPIFAFEPNPTSVQNLREKVNKYKEQVTVFPIALGSCKGNLPLNVSQVSPASSLLKNSSQLNQEFPNLFTEKIIDVEVERLDDFIDQLDLNLTDKSLLVKIDVQGFELEVLKGSTELFPKIAIIVCEVNLSVFYENQCGLNEIISFLYRYDFRLIDISKPIRSNTDQRILYVDMAFIHQDTI